MRSIRPETNYLVVHCSATSANADIGAVEIDQMHKARGWQGIGYHIVIRRNGKVDLGEDLKRRGAHVKSHNYESVGICLIGGIDKIGEAEFNYTVYQMQALIRTLKWLKLIYPDAVVLGHRDLSPDLDGDGVIEKHEWMKECPCFGVPVWWETAEHALA